MRALRTSVERTQFRNVSRIAVSGDCDVFLQVIFLVKLLTTIGLYDKHTFYVHVTVHRNKFLYNKTN
jgi:hypothetical protein